jgi:glucosylceramidase
MLKHLRFLTVVLSLGLMSLLPEVSGQAPVAGKSQKKSGPHHFNQVEVYLTAQQTQDRLTRKESVKLAGFPQPEESFPTLILDASKTFQSIEGFGGALTDAAAETYAKLPEKVRQELLNAYFNPETGIGYSLCRTQINSCDFSSDSYAYDDTPGDLKLEKFSIAHDRKFRLPLIQGALRISHNGFKLFASPWSPPAWMKTNNNMLQGGSLKPECRQAWADYFARFIQEYGKEGVPIWAVTVQNEPMAVQSWESCVYSAVEERDFVRDYLGPALARLGLGTKIIIWDHNRGIMYQRAKMVYDDPQAAQYVWGAGFHWYVGDHFDNVRLVHEAYPHKKLLFTEGTPEGFDSARLGEWQWGELYARSILNDLNHWANGWVDWNILLDEQGGPNHVGNFCIAPIIGDTQKGSLIYLNSYYYLGHFSKFIRPGARRIICSSNADEMLAAGFLNPDGSIAVVMMNSQPKALDFRIWLDGNAASFHSPAHSIMTLVLKGGE